jgi:hypothetical protein
VAQSDHNRSPRSTESNKGLEESWNQLECVEEKAPGTLRGASKPGDTEVFSTVRPTCGHSVTLNCDNHNSDDTWAGPHMPNTVLGFGLRH